MKKIISIFVFLLLVTVLLLKIYANVMNISKNLEDESIYLKYIYFISSFLLVYILIIRPILIIVFSPFYSVSRFLDNDLNNNKGIRKFAKRLIKKGYLSNDNKEKLQNVLKDKSQNGKNLSDVMLQIYKTQISKNIDDYIISSSKDTFLLTAISQSRFVDMLVVLINNFRMVKKIISLCGFRPTFLRTIKLFSNIIASSLIADGIQQIEISTIVSTTLTGFTKYITDSAFNGALNSIFMLRVGALTKLYLYDKKPSKNRINLKNSAFAEAVKMFPLMLSSLITSPIKKVFSIFKTNKEENNGVIKGSKINGNNT